jgi:hypothetical protein
MNNLEIDLQNKKEKDHFWEINNKILYIIALIILKLKLKLNSQVPNLTVNFSFIEIEK